MKLNLTQAELYQHPPSSVSHPTSVCKGKLQPQLQHALPSLKATHRLQRNLRNCVRDTMLSSSQRSAEPQQMSTNLQQSSEEPYQMQQPQSGYPHDHDTMPADTDRHTAQTDACMDLNDPSSSHSHLHSLDQAVPDNPRHTSTQQTAGSKQAPTLRLRCPQCSRIASQSQHSSEYAPASQLPIAVTDHIAPQTTSVSEARSVTYPKMYL